MSLFDFVESNSCDHTVNWYIAFIDSENLSWWRWFTCKGFGHCFVFTDIGNVTQCVDYLYGNVNIRFEKLPADVYAFELVSMHNAKVLKVKNGLSEVDFCRGLLYCVSLSKSILSLRKCFAITPYQLYLWLKNSTIDTIDINELNETFEKRGDLS